MLKDIKTIVLGQFNGNCYLLETDKGFILIDSGARSKRGRLIKELVSAGCLPRNLRLIILTHGDFDHSGNCAYLREKYGAEIAMHFQDSGMVEYADIFWSRKSGNRVIRKLITAFLKIERFKPDLTIDESSDLSEFGLDAKVLHIPGHSKGSIGILTTNGELFCGDLLINLKNPQVNSLVDDRKEMDESIDKVKRLHIKTVFPGHGQPFQMSSIQ